MAGLNTGSDTYFAWMEGDPVSWDEPLPDPVPGFTFMPHDPASVAEAIEPSFSTQARGSQQEHGRINEIPITASIPYDWRHQGFEKPIQSVFGIVSNTEVAAFVINASNNKINFQEVPDGPELTATIPSATYTSTTLCAAIKEQMEAAGSGATYTVTYDPDTQLFTIDCDTYLNLLFSTGADVLTSVRSSIGFNATDIATSATPIDIESDQEADVLDHGFTVTASNHSIDFRESAGGTIYQATLAHGTFNSGDICADIKAKMEAGNASAVVYTVTYDVGSRHFTIASDGSYLQLMFAAGPNAPTDAGALLGYSGSPIDPSAPISLTSTLQAEVSEHYFDIGPTNKYIDFKEASGGGEFNAVMTEDGGLTSGEVCDRIVSSMEAAGAGLYIATYDISNAHFTIRSNLEYLSLLWTSGTNTANSAANLLGFTGPDVTDTATFTPIVSQNEVEALRDNVFELPEDLDLTQPNGMTWYQHLNKYTNILWNVFVNLLAWSVNANFLKFTTGINCGRVAEAEDSPIAYEKYSERPAVVKGYMSVTIDDSANGGEVYTNVRTKSFTVNVPCPVTMEFADHASYAVDAARSDKIKPEVSFNWFRNDRTTMDQALEDRYRSGTPIAMTVTITSPIPFSSGHYKRTVFYFPSLVRKGASPSVTGSGPIEQAYTFTAQLVDGETTAMRLTLRNAKYIAVA